MQERRRWDWHGLEVASIVRPGAFLREHVIRRHPLHRLDVFLRLQKCLDLECEEPGISSVEIAEGLHTVPISYGEDDVAFFIVHDESEDAIQRDRLILELFEQIEYHLSVWCLCYSLSQARLLPWTLVIVCLSIGDQTEALFWLVCCLSAMWTTDNAQALRTQRNSVSYQAYSCVGTTMLYGFEHLVERSTKVWPYHCHNATHLSTF